MLEPNRLKAETLESRAMVPEILFENGSKKNRKFTKYIGGYLHKN